MRLFRRTPPPAPTPPPAGANRRTQRQYDHDVQAWRVQNKASVQGRNQARDLLAQSRRARECGDTGTAEGLAREAYAKNDAANAAVQAAEQRMLRSRQDLT